MKLAKLPGINGTEIGMIATTPLGNIVEQCCNVKAPWVVH